MVLSRIEKTMLQLIKNNEKEKGEILFQVNDENISKETVVSSTGFLPLFLIVSETLEKMLGQKTWTKELFSFEKDDNAVLNERIILNKDKSSDIPLNLIYLTLSYSVETLLDSEKNTHLTLDEEGKRTLDLVGLVSELSTGEDAIKISETSSAFSIEKSNVLSVLYLDEKESEQRKTNQTLRARY